MRYREHRRAPGFTLLEILAAFIVLAVAGGALLQLFQGGMRNVAYASEYSHAALLARSKLAELEARSDLLAGEEEGSFDDRYRWRLLLTPYVDPETGSPPEAPVQALRASLSIAWGTENDARSYDIDTLLLAAAPADRAEANP